MGGGGGEGGEGRYRQEGEKGERRRERGRAEIIKVKLRSICTKKENGYFTSALSGNGTWFCGRRGEGEGSPEERGASDVLGECRFEG